MEQQSIDIFYKKNEQFRSIPVGGVWGGLTPQGAVYANFFIERQELPERIQITVNEGGVIKETSRTPNKPTLVREVLIEAMMDPEVARTIGQWLIDKAAEYEKQLLKSKSGK